MKAFKYFNKNHTLYKQLLKSTTENAYLFNQKNFSKLVINDYQYKPLISNSLVNYSTDAGNNHQQEASNQNTNKKNFSFYFKSIVQVIGAIGGFVA
jgi:hypothetical protein